MKHLLTILFFTPLLAFSQAGDDRLKELQDISKKEGEGWVTGGALGLDFAQLSMINPRIGAGDNRIALGGLGNIFTTYTKGKNSWNTTLSVQLAVQQLAGNDWQKSLDLFRINSKYAYQTNNEKWAYATLLTFETLTMPTYPNNFLKKQQDSDLIQAEFLSPARLEFSPGIDYKPSAIWSFFLSPISYKLIYVGNQDIANLGLHGTKLKDDNIPGIFEKSFHQAGGRLVSNYKNKFLREKIVYTSRLDLFSNYLKNPQNIDVLWQNDLGWQIWKNFSLNFLLEAFYDHDIEVQVKRPSEILPNGQTGRRVSWTQALLLKYNVLF